MRHFLATTAVIALATSAVHAADLPRQMVMKAPPAYVAYNWTGLYAGINGGGAWGSSRWDSTGGFNVSGGLVGGTLGYNWQLGTWVVGLEGDLDWADIQGTVTTGACPAGCQSRDNWLGTIRGRVGYAFDRWLPYVTGGLAVGGVQASVPGFSGTTSTQAGWTAGLGVEYAVTTNWRAKLEYLHVDLGSFNCGLGCGPAAANNVNFTSEVVRGGVSYRF
jgi:outer membrane immunogenic protein